MKKIIFSTMIASLLAFVGCQNEELVNENTNNGGEKVILTANIQGAADSRVVLTPATDDKGKPIVKVAWNESEETFEVYGSSGASSTFSQIPGTNQFEGELPETAYGEYEAVYGNPYSLVEQDGKLGQSTADDSPVLMSAEFNSSSPSITFEHVTAILKPTFKVNGTDINNTITNINNTITKIVMGDVVFALGGTPEYRKITIAPTSPATTLADVIYIHLPIMMDYTGDTFTFTVTADGKNYTGSLTIPTDMSIEAGNLYTATIDLAEVITYCYLPSGAIFNAALCDILDDNSTVTAIEFVAGSNLEGTEVYDKNVSTSHVELNYKIVNNTLQLHTSANKFKFPENCSEMFCGYDGDETSMDQITTIQFNDCIYTSEVTNMSDMFYDCLALTTIDLSSFNTSKVTEMIGMFSGCSSLTSLDLSSFNTSNVTTMNSMFASSRLQSITFGESFDTSKVTSMLRMFENCSALTTIDFSGFDTSNVTEMDHMFNGCSSLTTLDLSSFTAEKMGSMYMMFNDCTNLEKLYLQNFVPDPTKDVDYLAMFKYVGSGLPSGSKTKIYVATGNPFDEYENTRFDAEKAEYIEVSQNN